jgi:hypothetical protein
MADPDVAMETLRRIALEFADFVAQHGTVSEADTRANVIDKILTQVCYWPDAEITREEHVESGYMDYSLRVHNHRYIAVEAKREGIAFTFPQATEHKTLSLSGTLVTDPAVEAAINQVRGYCDDAGIRYAVATNGYAWIVFRAIREDKPWRKGFARIFPSLEYIQANFTDFWNLLSYDRIQVGSLDSEFGSPLRKPRQLHRVLDHLYAADLPLQRNRLHAQLHPLIQTVFENIADQNPLEVLQTCYVHTGSLRIIARDLNAVITDAIPEFLLQQGAEPIKQTSEDAGSFGDAIAEGLTSRLGELYLLLGGIGSGKTTFIKRYEREVGKPILEDHALWFHLDFLEAPIDPLDMEEFVWEHVLRQLRARYDSPNLESRRNIKRAFADNIEAITQTALRYANLRGDEYEKALSPYLERWQADMTDYVPRLLKLAKEVKRLGIVFFIDNVDQLAPAYQAQIFLLAQRITRSVGSITILSLREESYYTANLQKTLTAYTNRKFHIASPWFRRMIDKRIRFAIDVLENDNGPIGYVLGHGIAIDRPAIADFLRIIDTSIFEQNHNIARLIDALCFGNMRVALNMFTTFMTSGVTDVSKMLTIYRASGSYFVAFHEFVKSIMLDDRRYYRDAASAIMNVFDCGAEKNSSHFTCLRVLKALMQRRSESTMEGQGYVEIARIVGMSEDIFDNREDVIRSLNRMLARQLIEANTRSTDSIAGASHVRVTSAGWYYARFLVTAFSYLDLVLQDTPFNEIAIEEKVRGCVIEVDNLIDREEDKLPRMQVRFLRVRVFLSYLNSEEEREQKEFDLARKGGIWSERFVPPIIEQIEKEVGWIERRLKENRERVLEDIRFQVDDGYFESEDEQGDDDDVDEAEAADTHSG